LLGVVVAEGVQRGRDVVERTVERQGVGGVGDGTDLADPVDTVVEPDPAALRSLCGPLSGKVRVVSLDRGVHGVHGGRDPDERQLVRERCELAIHVVRGGRGERDGLLGDLAALSGGQPATHHR
jgi:hypothetical protein